MENERVGASPIEPQEPGSSSQPAPDQAGERSARSFSEDGAPPASSSPRLVIRGENPSSSDEATARTSPDPQAAFTDWLNVTYPAFRADTGKFFEVFSKVTSAAFGALNERPGRGLHGYARSFEFQHGRTLFAIGGQRETAFISMSGDGCALVQDWPALVALLRDRLDGRITRWDGATDDYEGRRSVDSAVEAYRAGGFNGRGRKPSCSVDGDWIDPQGKGRTFYVGNRENGKLLRVYEKGKQLGEAQSPWVRWEVELHNVDRVIPWEVLLEPGRYLAGAYPALTWVQEEASRIATLKKADGITYDRAVHYAKQSIGRLVNVMVEREGSPEGVVEELRRDGVPKRLELTERLGLRGEKKKK